MYAEAHLNPAPARQSPESSLRSVRSPPGESTRPPGSRQSLPHNFSGGPSNTPPSVQGGLSPKGKQLPDQELSKKLVMRRGSGENQKPDTEGVSLLNSDSSDPRPSLWDGPSRGGGRYQGHPPGLPGPPKGRGAGQKPDTEDLLIIFDTPGPQPPAPNSVSREPRHPPPPSALPTVRSVCQGQGNNGAPPVDSKPDTEGVSINPDRPHPQPSARIETPGKQTPAQPREGGIVQGQGHNGTPLGDRKPGTEGVSISPNAPHPQYPTHPQYPAHPQSPARIETPGKQSPVQSRGRGTGQGQGHNRDPPGDRKPDLEPISTNSDPLHPQSPARGDTLDKQLPVQPRGRGTGQGQGLNGNPQAGDRKPDLEGVPPTDLDSSGPQSPVQDSKLRKGGQPKGSGKGQAGQRLGARDFPGDQNYDGEGGAPISTGPPDTQVPVHDSALPENKHFTGARGAGRGRGRGRSGKYMNERNPDSEVAPPDSSDTTKFRDRKSKGDPSGPGDGLGSKQNPMVWPTLNPLEQY